MSEFQGHFEQANGLLSQPLVLVLPSDRSTMTLAQFTALRTSIVTQQGVVQSRLTTVQIIRGGITLKKADLIRKINLFNSCLDGYFQNTEYYDSRPLAPSLNDGQEVFNDPLRAVLSLWQQINDGPAPVGVTLPLVLGDGTSYGPFASEVSALQFAYNLEGIKEKYVTVARSRRNRLQDRAHEAMRVYREAAPDKFALHPELVDSLPRLSPLPGHTPQAVNASAMLEGSNQSKVVHDASTDAMISHYELRGNAGGEYNDDAVVIASHEPGEPMEFVTPFALTQPGARAAFKIFVVLTTGNEAGSAAMVVQRPASVQLAA